VPATERQHEVFVADPKAGKDCLEGLSFDRVLVEHQRLSLPLAGDIAADCEMGASRWPGGVATQPGECRKGILTAH